MSFSWTHREPGAAHGTAPIRIPQRKKPHGKPRGAHWYADGPVGGPGLGTFTIHDCKNQRHSLTPITHTHNLSELSLTMTAKNRHKNSSSEKSAASIQEDASKKSQKSTSNGVSGPAPQGPRSGSCLGLLVTTLFYIALIGAAGFAAFYLQQVVEEIRQTNARQEESARQNAELSSKMESVVQQVKRKSINQWGEAVWMTIQTFYRIIYG